MQIGKRDGVEVPGARREGEGRDEAREGQETEDGLVLGEHVGCLETMRECDG